MTEKQKYFARIEALMKKGLKNVGFTTVNSLPSDLNEEELYAELNRMYEAKTLPDPEVLGRYSPKQCKL